MVLLLSGDAKRIGRVVLEARGVGLEIRDTKCMNEKEKKR